MKRIIIMLLIACSAITTVSADPSAAPQKKPESVIATLNAIIYKFGQNEGQVYSVNRNPNTGIIESSIKIVPFHCSPNHMQNDNVMNAVAINFPKDEPLAYQFLHIQPGSNENFSLKVITDNGVNQGTQRIRTNKDQEMWFMCCKNPENPQLRDAYAIVWEHTDEIYGTVYMITSLRPDMYEKSMVSNTFRIDGRVGSDLNDSLYVVYMADTAEELNDVADDAFVATMPVVNKRFNFSVEIDQPKVGRIRTVMPDGSLCKLWTNLDFVPGETYRITTHNGWYEEDRDYENRVGRRSGHSLLNDLQKRGIDDQTVEVVDTIPEEFSVVATNALQDWRKTITPQQQAQLQLKGELAQMKADKIKADYKTIGEIMGGIRSRDRIMTIFDQIFQENKELDKKYQEVIKLAKKLNVPTEEMPNLYKEILKFYTEQNKALNELFKDSITNGNTTRKLQEYVTKQIEKYIKEMEQSLQ
jgi:hypothetical protein